MSGNGTSKQDRQQLAIRREGVVSSKATGGKGGATPGDDGPGVNRIKALLARQREATSQAMQSADKPRRELDGGQGELSTEQTYVDTQLPDLYDLKQKFKNTENELELERRNHQSDLEQAASRIANLESTLSIAQSAAIPRKAAAYKVPKTAANREASAARWRIFFSAVILSFVGSLVSLSVRTNTFILQSLRVWDVKEEPPKPPEPPAKTPEENAKLPIGEIPAKSSEFSNAISHLDRALASFPGSPEQILKAVHNEKSANGESNCDFAWENGQPALLYRAAKTGPSISASMNNCATAIEHFRDRAEKPKGAK